MQDTRRIPPPASPRPDVVYLESATGIYRRWDTVSRTWIEVGKAVAMELAHRHASRRMST